jgi:hypothetical protein
MDASKYLPPFTQGQRGDVLGEQRGVQDTADSRGIGGRRQNGTMTDATGGTDREATYADFLGDEIDD